MSEPKHSAFDPARGGTPESLWQTALRRLPTWQPQSRHAIVVSPHPDDEILGLGGVIGELDRRGIEVTIVSVTDGERAYAGIPGLGSVRRRELVRALDILAPRARRLHLGFADGTVARSEEALTAALAPLVRPDTTLFAPFEQDGHPDHEAACRATQRLGMPVVRYPIWFWHRCRPAHAAGLTLRRFNLSPGLQRSKARAIQAFRSQVAPRGRPPILPARVLTYFQRPFETLICP